MDKKVPDFPSEIKSFFRKQTRKADRLMLFARPPSPAALSCAAARASAQESSWRPIKLVRVMGPGTADPDRAGVRYFPSVYDVPSGMRMGFTSSAWSATWRYPETEDATQRIELSNQSWAVQGKHSGRLLALEGLIPAGAPFDARAALSEALAAWVALKPMVAESNRQVLQRVGRYCARLFQAGYRAHQKAPVLPPEENTVHAEDNGGMRCGFRRWFGC
jgi:hypothetical protein